MLLEGDVPVVLGTVPKWNWVFAVNTGLAVVLFPMFQRGFVGIGGSLALSGRVAAGCRMAANDMGAVCSICQKQ